MFFFERTKHTQQGESDESTTTTLNEWMNEKEIMFKRTKKAFKEANKLIICWREFHDLWGLKSERDECWGWCIKKHLNQHIFKWTQKFSYKNYLISLVENFVLWYNDSV